MDAKSFLATDHRWSVWDCTSFQEYIDKFMIKGKFHSDVPEVVKNSYEIVERLIAYSYFHYSMVEEAISKMTRIFEMAVRIRTKSLDINAYSLSGFLKKLKDHPDIDPEMANEWFRLKEIRNFYAHPESNSFSGPMPLQSIFTMLNVVNRLFCNKLLFVEQTEMLSNLQVSSTRYNDGIFIFEMDDVKRLITAARPFFLSPDFKKSIWHLTPVYLNFPQTMDEFNFLLNPIIIRITDLQVKNELVTGKELISEALIRIYPTEINGNILAAKSYKEKLGSSDETVKILHKNNSDYMDYLEEQKFIYDEYWNY